ncbi:MAG: ribosome small subunit-dependent GTPase A [Candidatus Aminicenantes bacterium]|nr:ribosome small subunit-dependent GTPase A [Candidatus Aminicenantes bacterium]
MNITHLGFDKWFQEKSDPKKRAEFEMARVMTVNKNSTIITDGKTAVFAEMSGKFIFNADSPLNYPAVGDWVYVQYFNDNTFAVIDGILPRKSLLKRKTAGKKIEYQLIAANIDTAVIFQSLDFDYNPRRLERYLAMVHESKIQPIVLLSKRDLLSSAEIEKKTMAMKKDMPNIQVLAFSNKIESDLERIEELLIPGKTYCLLGSSGVGKTTLINQLMGEDLWETQPVREKDSKGRHTTARRQLIVLKNGALMIDTPGMRELGNIAIDSGLHDTFKEITALTGQCRYKNCSHSIEEGCAVLKALHEGKISRERYENYMKMKRESVYHEMSYVEKRRKDKKFGKLCKSVMKQKKNQMI